jgi:hypothetical protein
MEQDLLTQDPPDDVVVEDLTDAQKLDFLTSVGDVADAGTDRMHYHG